ncbi:MAG: hypothetical protein V8R82_08225 [Clostridia bacterium]
MKKIITAINNPIINEKLKNEKIEVIGKDIQYKEGILEILENNKEINFILINEKLPGEIKNEELINRIKKINKNIEIIFFIKKENRKNININENKIVENEKLKQKIKIVNYEKEIKIESFLNFILYGEENSDIESKENFTHMVDISDKKEKNHSKEQNIIISVNGDTAVGKKMTVLRLSFYLNKYNNKVLIIDLNKKSSKNLRTIFDEKEKNRVEKRKKNKKIKNKLKILKYKNLKYINEKIKDNMILKNKLMINKKIFLITYSKLIKIKRIKNIKKYYNFIFIILSENKKSNINKKIIENSNLNLLILEDNIFGIKKLKKIVENNYNNNLKNTKIIINKNNKFSIDENIIKNIFNNLEIIGKIKYTDIYNFLINSNFKNNIVLENKKLKKETQKIANKIIKI